ncbi:(2Fe-2S)-binding protein [Candidatus Solirubrobacter pratensis]|uniref:(2Fe-2S)-binding protein n=1 Tax=Candidatus Solirubrobacter pratensis TaxID=1298857 RepID=UPI0009DC421D|nr:2Fe-2S iron-sulfur cluster-binding protein [Candidatus Solirubrobacter pratensis]
MPQRTVRLNGKKVSAEYGDVPAQGGAAEASEPLLYWLRERHGERGPRFGCGVTQCGACTVLVDGTPVRSCTRQVHTVADGAEVRTLDGLASGKPHPLQAAFVDQQAAQCAFCINGMVMGSLGWLESRFAAGDRRVPSDAEVRDFLSGETAAKPGDQPLNYLCRCGAHNRIVAAIRQAAEEMVK